MIKKTNETLYAVIFSIINILITYLITIPLGICNVILYKSFSAMNNVITYEYLIWITLSLIESGIYEIYKKKLANENGF